MGAEPPQIATAAALETPALIEQPAFDRSAYCALHDLASLHAWIDKIRQRGYVAIDTETTSLDEMRAELVGISLAVEPGEACYIPISHKEGSNDDLFGSSKLAAGQMKMDQVIGLLQTHLGRSGDPENWPKYEI